MTEQEIEETDYAMLDLGEARVAKALLERGLYTHVANVSVTVQGSPPQALEQVFALMQNGGGGGGNDGGAWSGKTHLGVVPTGALPQVNGVQLAGWRSSSVGDIYMINQQAYMVDGLGFKEIH
jgi:hypothetical protein